MHNQKNLSVSLKKKSFITKKSALSTFWQLPIEMDLSKFEDRIIKQEMAKTSESKYS